jgi:transcriptional repressor NrdR
MQCPFCKADTKVVDKRDSGEHTRRRRECLSCSKRFTTYERLEESPLTVIKKDGRRQVFDRSKIRAGIVRACEKRPIGAEQIEKLVDELEQSLRNKYTAEVPSRAIGEAVMARLKQLDKVAYIRFASVYRQFDDIEEFQQELAQFERAGVEPLPGEEPLPGLDAGERFIDETIFTTPRAVATQGRTGHE